MAEAIAISMVEKLVASIFGVAKKEICYMCNCTENVEKFRDEVEKLKHMKGRVKQRIDIAKENGEDLLDGVQEWMDKGNAQISMAEEFLTEEANANKTCLNLRLCVNLGTLHHYGKKAITKGRSLLQHQEDGKLYETSVSVPAHSPGLLEVYQKKNLDDIFTHKLALGEIVQAIEDENIQIVGIYGLGGVGKTTLATEALATVKNRFAGHVFTTISQNVDVEKIKEEVTAAVNRILKGEKILIILDDMWMELKLEDLGIPFGANCKILLTTRSKDVCDAMNAQTSICVKPLQEAEAWILFKRVVGEEIKTDNNLKQIATKVLAECGGLPLIIQAVGKALKNKEIGLWVAALDRLQGHAPLNISSDIRRAFTHLKLSYDYLESEEARSCFLLCSMFPEDSLIPLERLVYYAVGLEHFNDLNSIEDARNRVRIAVNTLESSFLLLNVDDGFLTKMHDVVRDVALLIASEGKNKYLVEAGTRLSEWRPRNNFTDSYTGISLMDNNIRKLPDYEINFPHLDIFLIQQNFSLSTISNEFIRGMKEVKVLDMEFTFITSLPQSLKLLTNLRMLNLRGIENLREISLLGELKNLEILILNGDAIEKIPQEIGQLINLRRLEIEGFVEFHHTLVGVISKLSWLEELCIGIKNMDEGIQYFLVEAMKLSKLTFLKLLLPSFDAIPKGLDFGKLKGFMIQIGGLFYGGEFLLNPNLKHHLVLANAHLKVPFSKPAKKLLEVSADITLSSMKDVNDIMSVLYEQGFSFNKLESITLDGCHDVKWLVEHSSNKELGEGEIKEIFFMKIKYLGLFALNGLEVIWNCPDQYVSFCNLLVLQIKDCVRLVRLFSVRVAQGLFNLQELMIHACDGLEEVIWGGDEETDRGDANIVFPSLAEISLDHLYRLKSFYVGNSTIKYPSLVEVDIRDCKMMKIWGYGIHDTPKLKFVADVPLDADGPGAINDAVAKIYEKEQAKSLAYRSLSDSSHKV